MTKTRQSDIIMEHWMEITRLLRQHMSCATQSKMNPMQMHALLIIREHPGLTMKEFAQFQHITSPSATSFINRLVRLKWVKRATDPDNRKLVRLHVTEEGRKVVMRRMKEHTIMMRDVFSLLTIEDQTSFARILANLKKALGAQIRTL